MNKMNKVINELNQCIKQITYMTNQQYYTEFDYKLALKWIRDIKRWKRSIN